MVRTPSVNFRQFQLKFRRYWHNVAGLQWMPSIEPDSLTPDCDQRIKHELHCKCASNRTQKPYNVTRSEILCNNSYKPERDVFSLRVTLMVKCFFCRMVSTEEMPTKSPAKTKER